MAPLAATASRDPTLAYLVLVVGAVMAVAGYAIACAVWPFARCKKCGGSGTRKSPSGRAFRFCRRCKSTGRRLRTGRRIFNRLQLLRDEGTQ